MQHPTENNSAVLVEKEDSTNNNVNNNTSSTYQQQEQQQILKKRESRSSIISRAASRSTITVNSIYNTFARDDEDAISSLFDMPSNIRNHGRLSVCSSKFSLNCSASTCIDGKQQKQHHPELYHSQNNSNNNSNTNVDEMEHEKQQPIANRGHPNERRLSQSSSTVIHHYSIDYQDINSNENQQQQQQILPVEDHQDSNDVNENLISIPPNTNINVEDEADQAAIEYIKLTAERLWNEDEGICERKRIAEWLGTKYVNQFISS
ncbi:hypothetical protein INT45_012080 [Circinella minor]|uniref:Uncharacterized protein n=1 Tax=Circinella minor TaxID=1195481 RepID=A0A8H7SFA4_9FUNG|nr:hypothetical protein INT45_012080 [Circinella minor]